MHKRFVPNSYKLIFILLPFFLIGCETEIPLDKLDISSKIVVNSAFQPDSSWKIHLSQSLSVSDPARIQGLSHAIVNVQSEHGQSISLTETREGIYRADKYPVLNTAYTITVDHKDLASVKAGDYVPGPLNAAFVDSFRSVFLEVPVLTTTLEINDPIGEENYYTIEAILHYEDSLKNRSQSHVLLYPEDELSDNEALNGEDIIYRRIFLKDAAFSGKTHQTRFHIVYWFIEEDFDYKALRLDIHLRSVSKALYDYFISYEKFIASDVSGTFAQPVQVLSNIDGGLGIFGGFTEKVFCFEY